LKIGWKNSHVYNQNMPFNKIETRVKELLEKSIVIDGHSDILIPLTEGKMYGAI